MNVLVTGSEGFIGSHLVELLVKKKFKVKALVQYNSFNSWGWLENLDKSILKKVEIVLGDIRDLNEMIHHTKNQDAILHLAALIGIPYSYISPKNFKFICIRVCFYQVPSVASALFMHSREFGCCFCRL